MWHRWLTFIAKCSGPDLYLLLGFIAAPVFAFGGVAPGVAAFFILLATVIVSISLARRRGLHRLQVQEGEGVCSACRGTFALADLRMLARWVAVLGPSTWQARQNAHCASCVRRQELMVATMLLLFLAFGVGYIAKGLR